MTTQEFINAAYAAVQSLTDDGDQMHRRAVRGRRLFAFVHSTGKVTARVDGQFMDRGEPYRPDFPHRESGDRFAAECNSILAAMEPPVT